MHRVDLWVPNTIALSGAGRPTNAERYTKAWALVPCHFEMHANINAPSPAGRLQEGMIFTYDVLHVAEKQPISADWIIVNQSTLPDGTHGIMYHRMWKVQGPTKAILTAGGRLAGKQSFLCYLLVLAEIPTDVVP